MDAWKSIWKWSYPQDWQLSYSKWGFQGPGPYYLYLFSLILLIIYIILQIGRLISFILTRMGIWDVEFPGK